MMQQTKDNYDIVECIWNFKEVYIDYKSKSYSWIATKSKIRVSINWHCVQAGVYKQNTIQTMVLLGIHKKNIKMSLETPCLLALKLYTFCS